MNGKFEVVFDRGDLTDRELQFASAMVEMVSFTVKVAQEADGAADDAEAQELRAQTAAALMARHFPDLNFRIEEREP